MTRLPELPEPNATRFSPVRYVAETGSTNADLLAGAADGLPAGAVLVTDHQTAGRGRQRRSWHDQPGNSLLVSILLRPGVDEAPLIPLVMGLAAVDAIGHLDGDGTPPVGLKWPNDVLATALDERKLAGILAESTSTGGTELAVVVGMGMNLRWSSPPPDEVAVRAATVAEVLGRPVARDEVLPAVLGALELRLQQLETAGPGSLLDDYRKRCVTLGRLVRFETSTGDHEGTATDIDDRGLLVLTTGDGTRLPLHAGDAHHLPTEGAG
ncbi:MAG: biotin--[acetyl-CoA-carboxylase] ligase [Actinomycetota bacterium]